MKTNMFIAVVMIAMAAAFTSCISGYMPVDQGNEQHGRAIKKIDNTGATVQIHIEKQLAGNVSVTIAVLDVSKAAPVKLSNVKVFLAGFPQSAETYALQRVDVHYTSSHTGHTTLLKTYNSPATIEEPGVDMPEDGFYTISYFFLVGKKDDYPKKLAADIAATISTATGVQEIHESIAFRKYHNFSLYH